MKLVNSRAGIQTHNCFLLKIDVIQENRGGMDFSKEDGAAAEGPEGAGVYGHRGLRLQNERVQETGQAGSGCVK